MAVLYAFNEWGVCVMSQRFADVAAAQRYERSHRLLYRSLGWTALVSA